LQRQWLRSGSSIHDFSRPWTFRGPDTKKAADWPLFAFLCFRLACGDRVYRAGIGASAAIGAGVCIDHEDVIALADGFHRTGGLACAAGNALTGNYIGHGYYSFFLVNSYFSLKAVQYTSKNLDYIINLTP
jgi:hypothetical protein